VDKKDEKTIQEEVERIIQGAMSSHRIPSFVVGVLFDGAVLMEKAYGTDPIYTFGGNNVSNPYALATVSELFTGYGTLILAEQGRLSLDDPVSKYIPDVPKSWRSITILQFLTHQSGIPELPRDAKSFAAALESAEKTPLRFAPGTNRLANSFDFDVLGQIIEKAAHRHFLDFVTNSVFKPLKMNTSGDLTRISFRYSPPQDVRVTGTPNLTRSTGQVAASTGSGRRSDAELKPEILKYVSRGIPEHSLPSRGLVANADDLLKFSSAVNSGSLPGVPASPAYLTVAPGWTVCRLGEETMMMANGMTVSGFGSVVTVFPREKAALVLLWKLDGNSEVSSLAGERQEILEKVMGMPGGNWDCSVKPSSELKK
jgi:CubicO group peptidase (beta-lactamase class C family)